MRHAGDRDDENDQKHQHDVDQRCHVDVGVRLAFATSTYIHGHASALLGSGTEMIGCGDERHFAYADLLGGHQDLTHELVPDVRVAANMHLGLRLHARDSPK